MTAGTDPHALAARGLELAGIDYISAIFAGELQPYDKLVIYCNAIGSVHGGVALTLLDSAMGCAIHTLLEAGVGYTTLELKTNFVRPMSAGMGTVRCEGTVIHAGSRVATAEGRVTSQDGKLLAHGTTTCLILRP